MDEKGHVFLLEFCVEFNVLGRYPGCFATGMALFFSFPMKLCRIDFVLTSNPLIQKRTFFIYLFCMALDG